MQPIINNQLSRHEVLKLCELNCHSTAGIQ